MPSFGVIGLSTMGGNLARNAASRGLTVAVYNRTPERTDAFMEAHKDEGKFLPCKSFAELRASLTHPRALLLMVKAGQAVDDVIKELLPHLDAGDIIIDGGNSHYRDTEKRGKELSAKGIHFLGMGISGGEEGALKGPSMMPGGDKEAYEHLKVVLRALAAEDGEDGNCVSYMGPGGAGHFVKMVHNGIEYGIMQLIAESYDLLKHEAGLSNEELAEVFGHWNEGEDLQSFLIEITAEIFRKKDADSGKDLLDVIKDAAGQKGTGKWTTDAAMTYGVAVPTITAGVDARIISGDKRRAHRAKELPMVVADAYDKPKEFVGLVRSALSLSTLCAYAQGFDLIAAASQAEGYGIDIAEVARVWRGGCIIRSAGLKHMQWACGSDPLKAQSARSLIIDRFAGDTQIQWRRAVALGVQRGIPLPAMSASLAYYDACRRERLPQNLVQAQRDFFGAHTYERTDREGVFHTQWTA